MYKQGHGVDQDDKKAFSWFQRAAEDGNITGWYNLGFMYRDGRGTEQDYQHALNCFLKVQPTGEYDVDEEIRKLKALINK